MFWFLEFLVPHIFSNIMGIEIIFEDCIDSEFRCVFEHVNSCPNLYATIAIVSSNRSKIKLFLFFFPFATRQTLAGITDDVLFQQINVIYVNISLLYWNSKIYMKLDSLRKHDASLGTVKYKFFGGCLNVFYFYRYWFCFAIFFFDPNRHLFIFTCTFSNLTVHLTLKHAPEVVTGFLFLLNKSDTHMNTILFGNYQTRRMSQAKNARLL